MSTVIVSVQWIMLLSIPEVICDGQKCVINTLCGFIGSILPDGRVLVLFNV